MSNAQRFIPAGFMLIAWIMLGGCQSYRAPALSVASAEAVERTGEGISVLFTLDARNDNDTQLPLREVEYRVDLNGQPIFTGTRSAEATLRQQGIQQIRLPASAPLSGPAGELGQGVARYTISGALYYITPGQFAETLFDAGVRKPSVSFSFDGEIDLSRATLVAAPLAGESSTPTAAMPTGE